MESLSKHPQTSVFFSLHHPKRCQSPPDPKDCWFVGHQTGETLFFSQKTAGFSQIDGIWDLYSQICFARYVKTNLGKMGKHMGTSN